MQLAHFDPKPNARLMLVCGDRLTGQLRATACNLAHRTAECYSRPYLAPSLRDRTLCMLGAALDGVAAAAAIERVAAAERADAAISSSSSAAAAAAGSAALGGGREGGGGPPQLARELAAALSEGAFAENLAAYSELCCVWWWNEEGGERRSSQDQQAADSAAGLTSSQWRRDFSSSCLSPGDWAAAARAELAAKTLGLAAALMAQQLGSSSGGSGGGGSSRRWAEAALSKLLQALSSVGARYASTPLPGATSCGGLAAAGERRSGALRALHSIASGLCRAELAAPIECRALWQLQSNPPNVVAWVGAVARAAVDAQQEDAAAAGSSGGGGGSSGGVLVHVDWSCLDALLRLLQAVSADSRSSPANGSGGGGASQSAGHRGEAGVKLPADQLAALFPAVTEALRWTIDPDRLVELAHCAGRLWAAVVAAPAECQMQLLSILEGPSANQEPTPHDDPLIPLAHVFAGSVLDALNSCKKRMAALCSALVGAVLQPAMFSRREFTALHTSLSSSHPATSHSAGREPAADGQPAAGADNSGSSGAAAAAADPSSRPPPFRMFLQAVMKHANRSLGLRVVLSLQLARLVSVAPRVLEWYGPELRQLLIGYSRQDGLITFQTAPDDLVRELVICTC
jgi:hypothetical protein